MSICSQCGLQLTGDHPLCPFHTLQYADDWAASNRAVCEGLHRGNWPPRLPESERSPDADSFWAGTAEAA